MATPTASVFDPVTAGARAIAEMGWVLTLGAAVIFVGVMALLLLALRRGRRPGPRSLPGGGARWVIGGGLVFPVVVLSALLAYTALRSAQLTPVGAPTGLIVEVEARLWWWQVRYRDPASGAEVVTANEVRLPVGRPVTLGLASADVIHSFWVPALGGKVDMVPGRVHQLRVTVDRVGAWRGACAEFCGEQHARMALHVVAEAPEDFDRWLAAQARPADAAALAAQARRGREVFAAQRCAACHAVRGLAPGSALGPDLTHVGSRLQLGAGTLPNGHDALRRWVADVQQWKPGARMPSYAHLDDESLQAVAAFLDQLK